MVEDPYPNSTSETEAERRFNERAKARAEAQTRAGAEPEQPEVPKYDPDQLAPAIVQMHGREYARILARAILRFTEKKRRRK